LEAKEKPREPEAMAKKKKPTRQAADSRPTKWRPPKPRFFDWSKFDPSMVRETGPDSLRDELITYRDHLKELLRDEGKFVLIKGREIIGIYTERNEALREAISRFGGETVLIKRIAAKEPIISMGGVIL
jgi:hypothetical protein